MGRFNKVVQGMLHGSGRGRVQHKTADSCLSACQARVPMSLRERFSATATVPIMPVSWDGQGGRIAPSPPLTVAESPMGGIAVVGG